MRKFSKILAAVLSAALATSSVLSMPLGASAEEAVQGNAFVEGFENSTDAWNGGSIITEHVRSGDKALQLASTSGAVAYRVIDVEPNTNYFVSLWTKNITTVGDWWGVKPYAENDGVVDTNLTEGALFRNQFSSMNDWFSAQNLFNSGDNTRVTLIFLSKEGTDTCVDDIEIRKAVVDKENNLIKNGSFENGLMNWSERYHSPALLNRLVNDGVDGSYSAQTTSNYGYLAQSFKTKANTNYLITYSYKKTADTTYEAKVVVGPDIIGTGSWSDKALHSERVIKAASAGAWYTDTFTVNSGNYTELSFGWRGLYNTDKPSMYIDNVQVYEVGLVANGGLEYGQFDWGASNNGVGTIAADKITSDEVHSGNYAATSSGYSYVSTYFNAESNTDYAISFWAKNPGGNLQFRLIDGITQYNTGWDAQPAIEGYAEKVISGQSDWTYYSFLFNSGELTTGKVGIVLRGTGSSTPYYVDDVQVVKTGLVANGGIESGRIGWGGDYNNMNGIATEKITTEEVHSGIYAVKLAGENAYPYASTSFEAKTNTNYAITFWIKSTCTTQFRLTDGITAFSGWKSVTPLEGYDEKLIYGQSEWTKQVFHINTGDLTTGQVGIVFRKGHPSGTIYVDDVEVIEETIVNGGAEFGNLNWGARYNGRNTMAAGKLVTDDVYSGDYAIKTSTEYVSTYFTPEANTYYTVEFYAKGAWSEAFAVDYELGNNGNPNKETALAYMTFASSVWEKHTMTFWSGDAELISLAFKGTGSGDLYIDEVTAHKSTVAEMPAGDLNVDGTVAGAEDIVLLKQLLIGAKTEADVAGNADVNGVDGVNIVDLVAIKKLGVKNTD